MTGLDWRLQGNCTVRAAENFFPLSCGAQAAKDALATCERAGGCPVMATCLNWAVDNRIEDGVWGGRTAKEREKYGAGPMPERQVRTNPPPPAPRGPKSLTCSKGHRKTPDNRGKWICKRCSADRVRASRARQMAGVSA